MKGTSYEYIKKEVQEWPEEAKCYVQIWELDKWKKGRKKGKEHDAAASRTGNDLVKEISGFIKEYGPRDFRFVATGAAELSAVPNPPASSVTLMIDTLEAGKVQKKKRLFPVTGEEETCFEIGVVFEKTAGKRGYRNSFNRPVHHVLSHDDCICYLADATNPSARCGSDRIHYFVEAWFGQHVSMGERFYTFKYKNLKTGTFVDLGHVTTFEQLLRELGKDLAKAGNKNKKLGDLVILTHGITYTVNHQVETVKMKLRLFSLLRTRSLPGFDRPSEVDAEEIEKLMRPGSDYYNYVDGQGVKDGLISVVMKSVNQHVDDLTHVWLAGCNLGLNRKFMRAMRKLFAGKAVVYAFNKKHHLQITTDENQDVVGGKETLVYPRNRRVKVWTSKGIQSVVREPLSG